MAIATTYGGLKANVITWLNRDDMTARVDEFIDAAHTEIVKWLGYDVVKLVSDVDVNDVLLADPYAYEYGALREGFRALRNMDQSSYYASLFQEKLTSYATNGLPGEPKVLVASPGTVDTP